MEPYNITGFGHLPCKTYFFLKSFGGFRFFLKSLKLCIGFGNRDMKKLPDHIDVHFLFKRWNPFPYKNQYFFLKEIHKKRGFSFGVKINYCWKGITIKKKGMFLIIQVAPIPDLHTVSALSLCILKQKLFIHYNKNNKNNNNNKNA